MVPPEGPAHHGPRAGLMGGMWMRLTADGQSERHDELWMNIDDASVTVDGTPVKLSATEFGVLHYLLIHSGELVPWAALSNTIWGDTSPAGTQTLRVAVQRLQRKLGSARVHSTDQGATVHPR
jgi:DNA-binding response OmpR family regulator